MWAHNISKSEATGFSPFSVLYGQEPRLPMDVILSEKEKSEYESVDQFVEERRECMKVMLDLVTAKVEAGQHRQAERYESTRGEPLFGVGDIGLGKKPYTQKG